MFVMVYGLAITRLIEGQLPDMCYEYKPMYGPCVPFLVSENPRTLPTSRCCAAATQQFSKANNPAGLKKFCACMFDSLLNLGFYPKQWIQLPGACKIKISFSIQKCVTGNITTYSTATTIHSHQLNA